MNILECAEESTVPARDSRTAENPRTIFYFTVTTNENMSYPSLPATL